MDLPGIGLPRTAIGARDSSLGGGAFVSRSSTRSIFFSVLLAECVAICQVLQLRMGGLRFSLLQFQAEAETDEVKVASLFKPSV